MIRKLIISNFFKMRILNGYDNIYNKTILRTIEKKEVLLLSAFALYGKVHYLVICYYENLYT